MKTIVRDISAEAKSCPLCGKPVKAMFYVAKYTTNDYMHFVDNIESLQNDIGFLMTRLKIECKECFLYRDTGKEYFVPDLPANLIIELAKREHLAGWNKRNGEKNT